MIDDNEPTERSFLRRWSQRKLAASREATEVDAARVAGIEKAAPARPAAPSVAAPAGAPAAEAATELPPVESLTFDSDFTRFLQPNVDGATRQAALRKLFSDPRFNVMDGLDVYIDDYNKFEPLPAELVKQLAHAKYLFDPPKTRVNAAGHVEDVPDTPEEAAAPALESPGQDEAVPTIAGSESIEAERAPGTPGDASEEGAT